MFAIIFEKAQKVLMQKQPSIGFFKKGVSQNSKESICAGISFFDKVKLCRSALSLKARL